MDNYVRELLNDIEAGADTRYLMDVNYSMLAAGAIDQDTWEHVDNLILKSKIERMVKNG